MALKEIYNYECDKLLIGVDLFRKLLPHSSKNASIHSGEEGRFVESLVVEFLRKSLPSLIEVSTGFVVWSKNINITSGQIDILIFDNHNFSPLMRYGDAVIIHDQSLIAAISIKKNIALDNIINEVRTLSKIGAICGKNNYPNPYLAIFSLDIRGLANFQNTIKNVIKKFKETYYERDSGWSGNEFINDFIVLNKFIIKRKEWKSDDKQKKVKYIWCGANNIHRNVYVQQLVHGINKILEKRYKQKNSILTNFPKIGYKPAVEFNICTDDRPYISEP